VVFCVLVIGIIAVGGVYYVHQIHSIKKDKQNELKAIADLKSGQLMRWRRERMEDAEMLSGNTPIRSELIQWLKGDTSPGLNNDVKTLLGSMMRSTQYSGVFLFSADRARMMSIPEADRPLPPEVSRIISGSRPSCKPEFIDFHRSAGNGPIRLGILIPIPGCAPSGTDPDLGYLYLEIDPTTFLFPLIQSWPTPSPTAETLIVRREGNDILFLNELRHRKNTALMFRLPITGQNLPSVRAVRGDEGAVEGYDYRGKAVWAFFKKILDSPWFLVAKVDREEIYSPIRTEAFIVTLVIVLMIIGGGSVIGMWYRGRLAGFYRQQLELKQERTVLAERVNLLTRHANDIIFMLNEDWRILEANDRALEAYGYSLEEFQKMHLYELRSSESRAEFENLMEPVINQGGAVAETIHRRKDGATFPVESSVRLVEMGGKKYVMDIIRDITERRKAEEEVIKILTNLERSNKELEQFAYVASHDLQEPLRMVSSFTQLLARRYEDKLDQDARDYIDFAVSGANRMQRLIQDLLIYSRVTTTKNTSVPVDMNAILDEVLTNLQVTIKESGTVVTKDHLPVVLADHTHLIQVVQNLIGNAIKFRDQASPRIHISAEKGNSEWIFSVRDNGMGIEPQYFERIFVIFQRLHAGDSYQGTGIGLTLCKRIIQGHGGRIWVESEPGKGSTFYFTLKGADQ
jgi:PAS domain S-box-containing protein